MKKSKKALILFSAALLITIAAELLIFNASFFIPKVLGLKTESLPLTQAECFEGFRYFEQAGVILAEDKGFVEFTVPAAGARYVKLDAEGSKGVNTATILRGGEQIGQYDFSPERPSTMIFPTHAKAGEKVTIVFAKGNGLVINSIIFNKGRDFFIDPLRAGFILALLCGVAAIILLKLRGQDFDYKNKIHNRAVLALILVLVCAAAALAHIYDAVGTSFTYDYPLKGDFQKYGIYIQQTDAFRKGQLHLDIEIPEGFLAVENPYEPSNLRSEWRSLMWDKAYYQGKAYSYFGVAPVVLVYLPFLLLTGRMPSDIIFGTMAAMGSIVFIILLIREIVVLYKLKVKILTLLLGMTAAVFGGMVFLLLASTNFYTIAVAAGLVFLFGFLFFAFRGKRCESYPKRYIIFALSGLFLGLLAASRPNMAIYAAAIIPLFISVLTEKHTAKQQKWLSAAAFSAPLLLCGGALMVYNAARFSSPFDFGNNYQITVSEISKNTIDIKYFWHAVYHYLLEAPGFIKRFPFVLLRKNALPDYFGRWFYIAPTMGAFFYPASAASVFAPAAFALRQRMRYFIYICLTVIAAIIAFLDFCLAGVHVRYTVDIIPILVLVGVLMLLEFSRYKPIKIAAVILFTATILISLPFLFDNETHIMRINFPGLFCLFAHPILW